MEIKNLDKIKFDSKGLVPCIVQDINTKEVLMCAYMNQESIFKTIQDGYSWFYSRSRQELWKKGETSSNLQEVKGFYYDCDGDTLLLKVRQLGVACHTGNYSCFFNRLIEDIKDDKANCDQDKTSKICSSDIDSIKSDLNQEDILDSLYRLLEDRKQNPLEGSYSSYLFEKGIDKILKKVGEESAEVIIGAKNSSKEEMVYEISDLIFHLLVLMVDQGVGLDDIREELNKRRK